MPRGNDAPQNIRDAVQAIEELRRQTHEGLPKHERVVKVFTRVIGRPATVLVVSGFIIAWVVLNLVLRAHRSAFDDSTFGLLNTISQLTSLVLVISILSAQNTQGEIAQYRERLIVTLLTIQDQKNTEILNLLKSRAEKGELERRTDLHQAAEALQQEQAQEQRQ